MHDHHDHAGDNRRIGWAFFLNLSFTITEFIGGWLTNSTAIMADAVHDLGDSISIGLAWFLARLSRRKATTSFTYGYRRFSLLGALINGIVLIAGSIWVLGEALPRLLAPAMPQAQGMLLLAIFGVVVNGYAAWKLSAGKTLNERVLNWHLLEDVLGWVAVLIVAVVLMFFDWPLLDPLLSIGFTAFILFNVVRNLATTLRLFLQASPDGERAQEIRRLLEALPHVESVHHLHLWSLDGEHDVLTAHLVLDTPIDAASQIALKRRIADSLAPLSLEHTTIELEFPGEHCRDEDD